MIAKAIGEADVLDCYSGEGHMARAAWQGRKVVRIDKRKLAGVDHVGDNTKLAPELASSGSFRIIDLDAYGNPWPLWDTIVDVIPPGLYGFAITCGIRRSLIARGGNPAIQRRVGIKCSVGINLLPFYDDIVGMMLSRRLLRLVHVVCTKPRKTGLTVRYFGVLCEKLAEPDDDSSSAATNSR